MTDKLSGDPRLSVYASSSKGFPYGLTRDNAVAFAGANSDWARILAESKRQSNSPLTIIGAANIFLARAEAAELGWTSEDKTALYNSGVAASLAQWGVSGSAPATDIATQEWISWFPNGLEGWNVWRRTGSPTLTPAPGTTTGIPRRDPYGTNDYSYNGANVAAAAANYTVNGVTDSQWGRIWWDKQ
jgi:hypothetical protein